MMAALSSTLIPYISGLTGGVHGRGVCLPGAAPGGAPTWGYAGTGRGPGMALLSADSPSGRDHAGTHRVDADGEALTYSCSTDVDVACRVGLPLGEVSCVCVLKPRSRALEAQTRINHVSPLSRLSARISAPERTRVASEGVSGACSRGGSTPGRPQNAQTRTLHLSVPRPQWGVTWL